MKKFITFDFLKGYKTYIVIVVGVVYAITGVLSHNMTLDQATSIIFPLLAAGGIRKAM